MSKTIREIADELGVSKTAVRNKMTDDFRSKYVETSTANLGGNRPQTLVISEEGVNTLKSAFQGGNQTANLDANQPQTGLHSDEFYERQIESLQKLLDQSQQLLLNEQKKSQLLLEVKSGQKENEEWLVEKRKLENVISNYRSSYEQAKKEVIENYESAIYATRLFWVAAATAGVFFVITFVLAWIHFFRT